MHAYNILTLIEEWKKKYFLSYLFCVVARMKCIYMMAMHGAGCSAGDRRESFSGIGRPFNMKNPEKTIKSSGFSFGFRWKDFLQESFFGIRMQGSGKYLTGNVLRDLSTGKSHGIAFLGFCWREVIFGNSSTGRKFSMGKIPCFFGILAHGIFNSP